VYAVVYRLRAPERRQGACSVRILVAPSLAGRRASQGLVICTNVAGLQQGSRRRGRVVDTTSMLHHSGATAVLLAAATVAPMVKNAFAARKGVLFIVVDDMRPDLGSYNAQIAHTPNMDRLAATGMLFSRAYVSTCSPPPPLASSAAPAVAAPLTAPADDAADAVPPCTQVQYALCGPSRNSFMSGRRPDTTRVWSFTDQLSAQPLLVASTLPPCHDATAPVC
jgi:hypothetical protein